MRQCIYGTIFEGEVHLCFHLIQNDEPFENRSTPQLMGEKTRRWRDFKAEKRRRGSRRKRGKRR